MINNGTDFNCVVISQTSTVITCNISVTTTPLKEQTGASVVVSLVTGETFFYTVDFLDFTKPTSTGVYITNSATGFLMGWNIPTNTPTGCANCFSAGTVAKFGTGATCTWQGTTTLAVQFGTGATLGLTDTVQNTATITNHDGTIHADVIDYSVQPPAISPAVSVIVSAPTPISGCSSLSFTGSASGSAGRAWVAYSWSILSSSVPLYTNISDFLATKSNSQAVTLSSALTEAGNTYLTLLPSAHLR